MNQETLVDVLLDRADSSATITFVHGQKDSQTFTYKDLLLRAMHRLQQLQQAGLAPGEFLIIQTAESQLFIEAFWACLLGGVIPVPVSGGSSQEHRHKLFRIAEKLGNPGLFTDQKSAQRLAQFASEHGLTDRHRVLQQRWIDTAAALSSFSEGDIFRPQRSDTAFIQFSSGSTSTPKGIVLTHKNLMVNTSAIIHGCEMLENDHLLSWMPLTHDMGLIGFHLTPLVRNASQTIISTDLFVRRPGIWLNCASEDKATILCSPNFGYQHTLKSYKPERYTEVDLASVRRLFNGAEPISVSLCHQFMTTMAQHGLASNTMCPVYGLAEASLAVTFPPLDKYFTELTIDRSRLGVGQVINVVEASNCRALTVVSVGKPVNDVNVEIRDVEGTAFPDNTIGHICIEGGNVTAGYFQEPQINSETIDASGWLNTGDLGFVRQGLLYITGRAKDIIFVNGQNVYPHDLEEIVIESGLVERGKVAISSQPTEGSAEEQVLVFVLHRSTDNDLQDLAMSVTRLLAEKAGVGVFAVVPVPRIPKTTSGKIQRFLLVSALQNGEFDGLVQSPKVPVEQYNQEAIRAEETDSETSEADRSDSSNLSGDSVTGELNHEEILLAICNAQLDDREIRVEDNLFDLGISSLTLAQIHAAIEEQWPDQIDITDLFDYPTVKELAAFLDSRVDA